MIIIGNIGNYARNAFFGGISAVSGSLSTAGGILGCRNNRNNTNTDGLLTIINKEHK